MSRSRSRRRRRGRRAFLRWQRSADGGEAWEDEEGATGATLSIPASLTLDGYLYRAVFSTASGVETATAPALLSVARRAVTVAVTADPPAPKVGDEARVTATLTPATATGTVQFAVDGLAVGEPVAVVSGVASTPVALLTVGGEFEVTASYSGDAVHREAVGTATVAVAKIVTATQVAVTPAAPLVGDVVTFTATVDPPSAGGLVQFSVDGMDVGDPVAVVDGQATSAAVGSLPAGSYEVTAQYLGDGAHGPSSTAAVEFTVAKRSTTMSITSIGPDVPGSSDSLTVAVQVVPVPVDGRVQLSVDGTAVGDPVTVDAQGRATATLPAQAVGTRTVSAAFAGDDDLVASTGSATVRVFSPNEALVRRLYPAVLGRAADPSGISSMVARLDAGATVESILRRLTDSAEARRRVVQLAYERTLGRSADPSGLATWVDRVAAGTTPEDMIATLMASPEAERRHGEGPAGMARSLYEVHLGRVPSAAELASWANRIAADNTPTGRWRHATTFGRSPEAARVQVQAVIVDACGVSVPAIEAALTAQRASSGHHPLLLAGLAVALGCPPNGVGPGA